MKRDDVNLADVLRRPDAVTISQVALQLDALELAARKGPVRDDYRRLTVIHDEAPQ